MAKDYYESTGSDYLNRSPSVQKESAPSVPQHTHDDRYYRKEQIDASQDDYSERIQEINEDISQVRNALDNKSSINHIHNNATNLADGFMSYEDKRKLSSLGKTNIHIAANNTQTLAANADTKLLFNTFHSNTGEYDRVTDIVTIRETGMYMISGIVETASISSNNKLVLQVFKGTVADTVLGIAHTLSGVSGGVGGSSLMHLQDGDQISFRVYSSLQATTRGKENVKIARIW